MVLDTFAETKVPRLVGGDTPHTTSFDGGICLDPFNGLRYPKKA